MQYRRVSKSWTSKSLRQLLTRYLNLPVQNLMLVTSILRGWVGSSRNILTLPSETETPRQGFGENLSLMGRILSWIPCSTHSTSYVPQSCVPLYRVWENRTPDKHPGNTGPNNHRNDKKRGYTTPTLSHQSLRSILVHRVRTTPVEHRDTMYPESLGYLKRRSRTKKSHLWTFEKGLHRCLCNSGSRLKTEMENKGLVPQIGGDSKIFHGTRWTPSSSFPLVHGFTYLQNFQSSSWSVEGVWTMSHRVEDERTHG